MTIAKTIKIVLLGDSGVGKTSIAQRFANNTFNENNSGTIGASFISKIINIPNSDKSIKFQIWDTAGQEKYRSLASMYYKDSNAAIIVYDITKINSFEGMKFWVNELKNNISDDNYQIAIAANKSDLIEKEEVTLASGKAYADSITAIFKQTSAKENLGIDDLFDTISEKLGPATDSIPSELNKEKLKTKNNSNSSKNSSCC